MKIIHSDFHKLMKSGRITKVIKMATAKGKKNKQEESADDGHAKTEKRD